MDTGTIPQGGAVSTRRGSTPAALAANARNLEDAANRIDEVASGALELFKGANNFAKELALAQAMLQLRSLLTAEVMAPVMALMNTQIGFRTDKDPARARPGERVEPYGLEVVRDCFIESKIRGFRTVGNEWNIIAGGFYAAKDGFKRKLTDGISFPLLSNLKDQYDPPRLSSDGKGALVKCRATWLYNGAADSIECEFPIKVNSFMGADGIIGKAERKLLRRIHDRLLGVHTPEADDVETGPTINVSATEVKKPAFDDKPDEGQREAVTPQQGEAPIPGPQATRLEAWMNEHGLSFDEVRTWCVNNQWEPGWDAIGSIADVSEKRASRLLTATVGLLRALRPPVTK